MASRLARTSRRCAARRRKHEARAGEPTPSAHDSVSWGEVQALFERELARLPDRYRIPFVLCVLEEEPRADVARRLGIKEGTISSRLAEAKRRLQERLLARGVSLAVVVGLLSLSGKALSADLVACAVRVGTTGPVPPSVSALIQGGLMTRNKLLFVLAAFICTGMLLTGAAGALPRQTQKKSTSRPAAVNAQQLSVRGRLVDADGKPVANVPVRLWSRTQDKIPGPVAKTDGEGKFRLQADPRKAGDETLVVLSPPDRPAQWLPLRRFTREQTLKLPADDVPFTGRIANLENQPLSGMTVEVVRVGNVADGDLTAWIEKNAEMRKRNYWLNETGLSTIPGVLGLGKAKATSDAAGKFRLTGFGRDRILWVRVSGPLFATKVFWVVSRPGGPRAGYISTRDFNHGVYPPEVSVLLEPSRPLFGTVRDAKTGKPIAGVKVEELSSYVPASVTDEQGRYRLEGVAKRWGYTLTFSPGQGLPYFERRAQVKDTTGLAQLETNVTLYRGVAFTGRVLDKATGKPIANAWVHYTPHDDNPGAKLLRNPGSRGRTGADGTFRLTVWPGKGVLMVTADPNQYARVDADGILRRLGILNTAARSVAHPHAVGPIDVDEARPQSSQLNIALQAGLLSRKVTVVDPDGKPLSGAHAAGVRVSEPPARLASAEVTLTALQPDGKRLLVFLHREKNLGTTQTVEGSSTKPLTVKLQPLGSLIGEVQDEDGKPWKKLTVTAYPMLDDRGYENLPYEFFGYQGVNALTKAPWWSLTKRTTTTDEKGRFRLDGLIPGLKYTVYISDGDLGKRDTLVTSRRKVSIPAGKSHDLGLLTKGDAAKK